VAIDPGSSTKGDMAIYKGLFKDSPVQILAFVKISVEWFFCRLHWKKHNEGSRKKEKYERKFRIEDKKINFNLSLKYGSRLFRNRRDLPALLYSLPLTEAVHHYLSHGLDLVLVMTCSVAILLMLRIHERN